MPRIIVILNVGAGLLSHEQLFTSPILRIFNTRHYFSFNLRSGLKISSRRLIRSFLRRRTLSNKNENFQDILVCQYRDLIHEAIIESETEHKTRMDIGKLNHKLQIICKAAHYDGLDEEVISQLIDAAIPQNSLKAA